MEYQSQLVTNYQLLILLQFVQFAYKEFQLSSALLLKTNFLLDLTSILYSVILVVLFR